MSADLKKSSSNGFEKALTTEEQQGKINEVKKSVGNLPEKLSIYCSDASIARHLRARNWNVKKATKMLKETLKWRAQYKPEEIRWEEVAHEAETGKIYRTSYLDKHGRTILVMRPSRQNTKSTKGQIKYLVYCMENAILNLAPEQDQMVWLIDFSGYNLSHVSLKVTKETAHVLQDHYPERLGMAILFNPPKFFEPFWMMAKAFLEPKTFNKVKFVYSDDPNSMKIMEDLFDMEQLESSFGGKDTQGFNINIFAERMKEDDKRMPAAWTRGSTPPSVVPETSVASAVSLDLSVDLNSDTSETDETENSLLRAIDSETISTEENVAESGSGRKESVNVSPDEVVTVEPMKPRPESVKV
ncbi:Sec14p-like phosphatidylinositol transfer family protein [Euphorbia peplus]|nr:Sec14p-like phosphatidylinositol transfer family protein [Euphorbia peplus]